MSDYYGHNVWEEPLDDLGGGISSRPMRRKEGHRLGATLWQLAPGSSGVAYHFHHGAEEMLVVLRGEPLLRSLDGEWPLAEGEVVHFPPGVEGSHNVSNPTAEVVRYLMIGSHAPLDIIEYPDEQTFVAFAKTHSQYGEPFRVHQRLEGSDS